MNSRELINSGGQSNSVSDISVVWSVGQPAIVKNATSLNGSKFKISQGFHKAEGFKYPFSFELLIYPNPFSSEIYVNISEFEKNSFFYSLLNVEGKELIKSNLILTPNQKINLNSISLGSYILKVYHISGYSEKMVIIKTHE